MKKVYNMPMNSLEKLFSSCPSFQLLEALDQIECRVSLLHGRKFSLKGLESQITYN